MAREKAVDPLVARLAAIQAASGMKDGAFARDVLGISASYWSKLRQGQQRGGGDFVRKAMAVLTQSSFSLPSAFPFDATNKKTA